MERVSSVGPKRMENNNKSISDTRWNEWELELLFESLFQAIIMVFFGLPRQVKIITVVII